MKTNSSILRLLTSGKFENQGAPQAASDNRDSLGQVVNDAMIRYVSLNVALMLGAFFLITFGITVFIAGNTLRSLLDFTVALICISSVFLLRTRLPFTFSAMLPVAAFSTLCAVLAFSGGVSGFAGLWIYAQPLIAIFILGLTAGSILSGLLLVAVGITVFVPDAGFAYESAVGFRILCVFILVFLLTMAYEWVRVTNDRRVKKLTGELETARLKAEEAAAKAEEAAAAKSSFLANTSHEIRTPMNAILGMTEMILRKSPNSEIYTDAMSIKQAGESLLSIINDILDFSKIESGKMELAPAEYYFESLIHDVVNIIKVRLGEKRIRFITDIDRNIPAKLYGDMIRIRQVLLNLLSNAVKYTEKGYIKLTVAGIPNHGKREGEEITLSFEVTDTGYGIKETDMDKLFGDFTRFDSHRNRSIEGTGLGLAISRNICRLMGGDITVQSRYGEGSVFSALIPQKVREERPIAGLDKAENKAVLLYERRDVYRDSLINSLKNLAVPFRVTNREGLFEELEKDIWPFTFVSPDAAEEVQNFIQEWNKKTVLVLLAKLEDDELFRDIPMISIPAHTVLIANVLNGVKEIKQEKKSPVRFTAPEARILIVDDISTNLNVARGLLSPYRMDITTCTSGKEAVDLVRNTMYDMVFMDHMMPEMDGVEATAAIRSINGDYFKALPIIALTANAVTGMKEMFLESGFSDYISKPIEIVKMDAMIAKWIPPEKQILENSTIAAPAEESTNMKINGVDTAKGMAMTGGTEAAYRKILAVFCKDALDRMPLLHNTPGEQELPLFTNSVHALKSASGTIGAAAVSKEAAELEAAGKAGDTDLIEKLLPNFYRDLKMVVEQIGLTLNEATSSGEGKIQTAGKIPDSCISLFRELAAALEQEQPGTIRRLLAELEEKPLDAKIKENLNSVANAVLMTEFGEAIKAVKELLPA
ncbi:hybrid sensor histidine kinase/response regulator [Treponema primitia]|uniref:hybrid sensor histidine kinase/response regulator n=1 Tax=Treponema primitia TaxID=88058 RepID=UPI00025554EE|nr:ATP-binding protein [Treponema primitia]